MTIRSFTLLLAAALCAAAASPTRAQTLEQALEVYYRHEVAAALPLFQALAARHPRDPAVRAWLAEAYLRLGDVDPALESAHEALRMEPCHAPAHAVLAATYTRWLYFEEGGLDSLWTHARRATECDADDGNAWLAYWMAGTMRRDTAAEARAKARLGALRFIPEPVMERGRWILRSAPANAVVVVNGDWDYYPMEVARAVEGVRPDVELVHRGLIEFPWYVRRVSARTGLPLPDQVAGLADDEWEPLAPEDDPLPQAAGTAWAAATLAGAARPLVVSVTAPTDWVEHAARPRMDGGVYTLHPLDEDAAPLDTGAFGASLRGLDPARMDGPGVHPTDRSPVRRTERHPAGFMVWFVGYYATALYNEGDEAGARDALALGDALIATGHVDAERAAELDELRAALAGADARP